MGKKVALALLVLLLACGGSVYAENEDDDYWVPEFETEVVRGRVLEVSEYEEIEHDWTFVGRQLVTVEITSGRFRGQVEELENLFTGIEYRDIELKPGDQVLLFIETDQGMLVSVNLYDVARDNYLYILVAMFVIGVILVAWLRGLKSLLTLVFMAVVIAYGLLPLILRGHSPLLLTAGFAALITLVTLTVIGGLNQKTASAILGTLGGLLVAGIFAWVFGTVARLTGFSTQDAQMLLYADVPGSIDFRGLLFAGIIIGALGAVLDVAMSIASSVSEISAANPRLSFKDLFRAGHNVGTDVLGTMINTLILAYAGSALPLLLLFMAYDMSYMSIINMDLIATEVVRALAGSFGLLTAAPLTAVAAALFMSRSKRHG